MADHPNIEFVKQAYNAMASADIPWMEAHTNDDVVFHQVGKNPIAGTFPSRDAMFGHFMQFMELTGGDFKLEPEAFYADGAKVVVELKGTFGRDGKTLVADELHVWTLDGEKVTEIWAIPRDPYEMDAFFS